MDMAQLRSKTIAVLAGGQSGEREVSFRSGKGVQEALERQGFRTVMVDPSADLYRQLQEVGAEVAFNALHGGAGEDGTIQALLELIGMP
ncbi:MAG: D-alanine--D-alanine ligase, partial [Armatimonadia bacterium]